MIESASETTPFPRYTRMERLADSVVHGVGLALAALALPWMLWNGFGRAGPALHLSLVLYSLGVALMFGCSALYNRLRHARLKALFRRLDRAVIFVMIAGTYSPLALVLLGPPLGYRLMAFEWGLALLGAALALSYPRRAERLLILLYLLMGWAVLAVLGPLTAAAGADVVALILAGALIYTVGVGIHAATGLRFHNALWHCCVLAAAGCHYLAILTSVVRPAP